MKHISKKAVYAGLLLVILFVLTLIGGFFKWPLFILAGVFIVSYIVLNKTMLSCPNCGGHENLDRLMHASSHTTHCRHCGKKITIA